MSDPVIDQIECDCCNVEQASNEGIMKEDKFICYTCRKAYKLTKQGKWKDKVNEQKAIIDDALDALKLLDVLDIVNVSIQLRVILDAQRHLVDYVAN